MLKAQICKIAGSLVFVNLLSVSAAIAQIVPDATLPVNSLVTNSNNTITITGGTKVGGNLFHSFKDFSVPTKGTAFFNNTLDTQNIITRVTGSSISNLDGTLKANGTANLFLINPNGINFGTNAALNIGGSFLGSTANSISFADGTVFSATNPPTSPLLTISIPMGLQVGSNAGAINVTGPGANLTTDALLSHLIRGNNPTNLQVAPGQSLALIGGAINVQGGILVAPGGRIELGSIGTGNVNFNSTGTGWIFNYQNAQNFNDINLSQLALVDASSSNGGGFISVQGRNVILNSGAVFLIENDGSQTTGDINVNASESVQLTGLSADGTIPSSFFNQAISSGNGGNINISTKRFSAQNSAQVSTVNTSSGKSGDLNLNASESVESSNNAASISVATFGEGDAGNLNISTNKLSVLQGANILNTSFSSGKGGKLNILANDIEIIGVGIYLSTNFFSQIGVTAYSKGNGGSLTINTSILNIQNAGELTSSTYASGQAGDLVINALKSVEVNGKVSGFVNPSLITASADIVNPDLQAFLGVPPIPSGISGTLTINTPKLSVMNGGLVSVKNQGSGNAGTLKINSGSIFLNNAGGITATTTNGEGGNIILQGQNITLRHSSNITATAAGTGNGGNLDLNTDNLVLLENSDITANAIKGRGGNININAQGLFSSSGSQITAVSQLGINGVVTIKTPDVDPNKGLVNLAKSTLNAGSLIGSACDRSKGSSFYLTGRGGIPPQPTDFLNQPIVLADLGNNGLGNRESKLNPEDRQISKSKLLIPAQIQEATGWEFNHQGQVVLTALLPKFTLHSLWLKSPECLSP